MIDVTFAYPKVMQFFEAISAIPRRSYEEGKMSDYLETFAKERDLDYVRDSVGNLLIRCPASAGYEGKEPLLLQGHTDMVCEKNEGVAHDFSKDPLKLTVRDGWLRAEGTTLGADNGVAVAVMLALLDGMAEAHPVLECLFTVSEEVGLDGAKAFDYKQIRARQMINMDSADENSIIVGCAGGLRSCLKMPIMRMRYEGSCVVLRISGLCGGHSGEDIDRGRANANKLMGQILSELSKAQPRLRLVSIQGGTKDNAIPREAEAVVCVQDTELIRQRLDEIAEEIRRDLCGEDEAFLVTMTEAEQDGLPMDKESTRRVITLLNTVVSGVLKRLYKPKKMVTYSRNLGIVSSEENSVEFVFSSRSPMEYKLDKSAAELDAFASQLGAKTRHYNRYPGWEYAEVSPLRERYIAAYRRLYGKEPTIEVIHAGLECGIIKQAVPDMDMLSCGPVVVNLHSPDEALNLASFQRFVRLILEVLKA